MGGRGSSGGGKGGGGGQYEKTVLGPQTERMSYSRYKNEFGGASTVQGSYDKGTKTIEVKVPSSTREVMRIVPDSVVKEFPSSMSRYQVAVNIKNQFVDMISSGEKLWPGAASWQKTTYNLVKTEQKLIGQYGSLQRAVAVKGGK